MKHQFFKLNSIFESVPIAYLLNAISFVIFFLVLGGVFFYINPLKSSTTLLLNLSGSWQLCIPNTTDKPDIKKCRFDRNIVVPHFHSPNTEYKKFHWLVYKKNFKAPTVCLQKNTLCSLVIGEIGDAAEIWLNGIMVGTTGALSLKPKYSKNHPIKVDLPAVFLKNKDQFNDITLVIYTMKIPQSGIRAHPVGIATQDIANSFVRGKICLTIIFPIFSAMILFLLGMCSLTLPTKDHQSKKILAAYRYFCTASSLFLISFSEIPREFLPMWLATHAHFLFRYMADWSLFYLVAIFFSCKNNKIRYIHFLYFLAIIIFVASGVFQWISSSEINDTIGSIAPYFITKKIFILKLVPMIFGLTASFFWKKRPQRLSLIILFSALMIMQTNDILVFLEVYSNIYFVKFYLIIIALTLGVIISKNTLASEESRVEKLASEAVSTQMAKQVAHDIRSPLAALDLVTKDIAHIPETQRLMVRHATQRIHDIANNLLKECRAENNSVNTPPESLALIGLLESIVSEKRTQYSGYGIQIELDIKEGFHSTFSRVNPVEFKIIISNVINNAIEAIKHPEGQVTVSLFCESRHAFIQITDNGHGIPENVLKKLFSEGISLEKVKGMALG